jgi:hypothetical protein
MPLESATLISGIALRNSVAIPHRPSSSNSRSGAPLPCEALGQSGLRNLLRLGSFSKTTPLACEKVDKFADISKLIGRLATSVALAAHWLPLRSHRSLGAIKPFGWRDILHHSKRGHIRMDTSKPKSSACSEQTVESAPNVDVQTSASVNSRFPFHFPEVGDEVIFTRSPSHERETGYVMSREYGTRCIEIIDVNAKPLRLRPGQYRSAAR